MSPRYVSDVPRARTAYTFRATKPYLTEAGPRASIIKCLARCDSRLSDGDGLRCRRFSSWKCLIAIFQWERGMSPSDAQSYYFAQPAHHLVFLHHDPAARVQSSFGRTRRGRRSQSESRIDWGQGKLPSAHVQSPHPSSSANHRASCSCPQATNTWLGMRMPNMKAASIIRIF